MYYDLIQEYKKTKVAAQRTVYDPILQKWFVITIWEASKDKFCCISADVTELKNLEEELREKKVELEKQVGERDEALKVQSRFLATMSHGELFISR